MRLLERDAALRLAQQLLELPEQMLEARRRVTALRAEQRTVSGKLARRETEVFIEAMDGDVYRAARLNAEREAVTRHACHEDDEWSRLNERGTQVGVALDKARDELAVLEERRKAIKGVLEREAAELVRESIEDGTLARAISQHRGVSA